MVDSQLHKSYQFDQIRNFRYFYTRYNVSHTVTVSEDSNEFI